MSVNMITLYLGDDDFDRGPFAPISARGLEPDQHPLVRIGYGLTVGLVSQVKDPLGLSDALLSAVTAWRDEIHRRGHADPIPAEHVSERTKS